MQQMRSSMRGMSLIEILVASALLVSVVIGAVGALRLYARIVADDVARTHAAILVQEAAEAFQLMRDNGWEEHIATLTLDTPYHLAWNGAAYSATTTEIVINERFVRTLTLTPVERDNNDRIVENGTEDEGTRKLTITISRARDAELLMTSEFLLHNIYEQE